MDAIREIRTVIDSKVIINLPKDYAGREIEIIILPLTEKPQGSLAKVDFSKFYGIYSDRIINIDKEIKELREEWERDI